jgi:hypothetical protein
MPVYLFQHPKTGKVKEIFQSMNDNHIYSEDGIEWQRIFTIPQASIDTEIDAFSEDSFKKKTAGKRETLGDLMDRSKELSEKRQSIAGTDPVQNKFFEDYSKTRKGKKHHKDPSREIKYNKNMFSIE